MAMRETKQTLCFVTHGGAKGEVEVRWRRVDARPPFHGAWTEEVGLAEVVARIPADLQRHARLVGDADGWFVVLLSGETAEPLSPWPLKRMGSGPFAFHPADVAPAPFLAAAALERACGGAHLAATIVEGRVSWRRWDESAALRPVDLLRLPVPVVTLAADPPRRAFEDPPREPPAFLPEELPRAGEFEREEEKRLAGVKEPRRSFWSRLFRRDKPPEWEQLKPAAPGVVGPGFLRRIFDRQAAMFDRLARLFERGDLDLALKHSIPIDNEILKGNPTVATSWRLPEHGTDYSFRDLARPGGPIMVGGGGDVFRLMALYRKAAESLARDGRHRQAAYVYAHLLKDFAAAAHALEAGGFFLEAATLVKEKLRDRRRAAEILERGGLVAEAAALYLEDGRFEAAAELCRRSGLEGEERRCLGLWLADLRKRGLRLEAGDLLRTRLGRPDEAADLYRAELGSPSGLRGEAGGRLVELEFERGEGKLEEWARCEAFFRKELDDPRKFADRMKQLVTFHREARRWAHVQGVGREVERALFRRTREALLGAVREAQARNETAARGGAVDLLSEVLREGEDPLAVLDLRKGLEVAVEGGLRPRRRAGPGGIRPLPGGGYFCWAGRRWASMDGSGLGRTAPGELGSLPRSLAVHPETGEVGIVTHDHRFVLARLEQGSLRVAATRPIAGALAAGPASSSTFLVGTEIGAVLRVEAAGSGMEVAPFLSGGEPEGVRHLEPWPDLRLVVAAGDGADLQLLFVGSALGAAQVASPVGAVDRVAVEGPVCLCHGRTLAFGLLRPGAEEIESLEVEGPAVSGMTALALCGEGLAAWGTEEGAVGVAALDLSDRPRLDRRAEFRTLLGPIVALQGLEYGRLLALDGDFQCALVDLRSMELVYQGPWQAAALR
jgi:hypothetical protein